MNIQLSKREKNILLYLLTTQDLCTSKELSDSFDISVRTVKYDLENIRFWLKSRHVSLSSKRGKGVWIDVLESQKMVLKNELLKLDKEEAFLSQDKRINKLIFELLSQQDYLTSEQISKMLQVTKNTVIHDIDKAETLLNRNNLILLRQNGKGFKVKGDEPSRRLLLEQMIQQEISEYDIYNIMSKLVQGNSEESTYKIYIGVNEEFQEIYETTINHMSKLISFELLEKLNYSEILSITIRTAISIFRLMHQETIGTYKLVSSKKSVELEKDIPFILVKSVFESYSLPVLEAEFSFIYSDVFDDMDQHDIQEIAVYIIKNVGESLDHPFYEDAILATNLFAHLSMRLSKKHLYIHEYNPFVLDIKSKYPKLFLSIKKASQEAINGSTLLVNDSFVAYLALHFLVSIEKNRFREKITVVYVCSSGLGVTSLLQQTIQDELSDVEILSFASILNLREEVEKRNPDLIISIFPIEGMSVPWIKVNPLPSSTDIKIIQEKVNELLALSNKIGRYRLKPMEIQEKNKSKEEESRELIVKGYIIYSQLKEKLADELRVDYLDSFLLHVFLMVHRIEYNGQYLNEHLDDLKIMSSQKKVVKKIAQVFSEQDLAINQSEIVALLQYINK